MKTDTQKQIAAAKAKLEALENKAAAESARKLENLHASLGFASRNDLIAALASLEEGKVGQKRKSAAKKATKRARAAKAPKAVKRSKRAKITEELKAKIVEAVKQGGKGSDIAKEFGISIPSLQNIKKAAGLTKSRSKK